MAPKIIRRLIPHRGIGVGVVVCCREEERKNTLIGVDLPKKSETRSLGKEELQELEEKLEERRNKENSR